MRPLTADGVVRIWEAGQRLPPVERDLLILRAALPEHTPETLGALLIGEEQNLLFRLRALTFGERLDGLVECAGCGEPLEFTLDLSPWSGEGRSVGSGAGSATEVGTGTGSGAGQGEIELAVGIHSLLLRSLRVADLLAAADCGDAASARRLLVEKSIVRSTVEGREVMPASLPVDVLARVAEVLTTADERAELLLDLLCPACGTLFAPLLDPGDLLWNEIRAVAARLIREVHALARAYGWGESEILSMSAERRAAYLSLVEA